MKKTRTSVSLPAEALCEIRKFSSHNYSHKKIALLCLKRLLSKKNIHNFEKKPTCTYNPESATEIITIWLTNEEHYNLKIYRVVLGLSISFLLYLAIKQYLPYVIKLLKRLKNIKYSSISAGILNILQKQINSIHRKIKYSYKSIVSLGIVMPRQNPKWKLLQLKGGGYS